MLTAHSSEGEHLGSEQWLPICLSTTILSLYATKFALFSNFHKNKVETLTL